MRMEEVWRVRLHNLLCSSLCRFVRVNSLSVLLRAANDSSRLLVALLFIRFDFMLSCYWFNLCCYWFNLTSFYSLRLYSYYCLRRSDGRHLGLMQIDPPSIGLLSRVIVKKILFCFVVIARIFAACVCVITIARSALSSSMLWQAKVEVEHATDATDDPSPLTLFFLFGKN